MPKKRKKRRRRGAFSRLLRPLSLLLAAAAIVAALTMFFKVESIQVAGASRYQADEIIAASGVEPGDNLVLLVVRVNRPPLLRSSCWTATGSLSGSTPPCPISPTYSPGRNSPALWKSR